MKKQISLIFYFLVTVLCLSWEVRADSEKPLLQVKAPKYGYTVTSLYSDLTQWYGDALIVQIWNEKGELVHQFDELNFLREGDAFSFYLVKEEFVVISEYNSKKVHCGSHNPTEGCSSIDKVLARRTINLNDFSVNYDPNPFGY